MADGQLTLDTSAYSAFKRGHREVLALVRRYPTILVPAIAVGELLAGFARGNRRDENRRELRLFLDRPRVTVTAATSATAERYAAVYAYLRAAGKPIPTADMWIAASAMEHGAELVTLDAHFTQLPQIIVHHFED